MSEDDMEYSIVAVLVLLVLLVTVYCLFYAVIIDLEDRLCGLAVRVSGYRYRGPVFDSRHYQIF
jgi:hypothetical protein